MSIRLFFDAIAITCLRIVKYWFFVINQLAAFQPSMCAFPFVPQSQVIQQRCQQNKCQL